MSELKDYSILDIEAIDDERLENSESGRIYETRVYIKSDADKAIAELEESHKKEVSQLLILNREQANSANRLRYSMEQVIRHQKYKRCLAMAHYCYTNVHCIMGHRLCALSVRKKEWFERWHKRWLELADKFKEGT